MKDNYTMKSFGKEVILLQKNQVASLKGNRFQIKCLDGTIWVTWPNSGELILHRGETTFGRSKGKVCIMAFSNAIVEVEQKSLAWLTSFSSIYPHKADSM